MARLKLGSARRGDLTESQRDYLTSQNSFLFFLGDDEEIFASEAEAAAAWRRHRSELMLADRGSWLRPWGYYKFELDCEPHWWHEEIACLLERDLIPLDEIPAIEKAHQELAEDGGTKGSSFENPEWIRAQGYTNVGTLNHLIAEFALAARWHQFRGRDEVSKRFQARAETVRGVVGAGAA